MHIRNSRLFERARRVALAPVLVAGAIAVGATSASAQAPYAALIVDAHTGQTLHAQNADAQRFPASLTKVMTLYVLFELLRDGKLGMDTDLVVSANAAAQAPSKIGLPAGRTIKVRDAIRALITKSANDIAVVVAENIAGTEDSFARIMTTTARRLGMRNTTFRNASGLPNAEQVTTARDMVTLGRRMIRDFPNYYEFFSTRHFAYAGTRYRNHNKLLFDYAGTDGIKTGFTRASGFNLLASVRRDDRHVIGVVIGGRTGAQRDAQMRRLLDQTLPRAVARAQPMPAPLRNPVAVAIAAANTMPQPAAVAAAATTPQPAAVAAAPARPAMASVAAAPSLPGLTRPLRAPAPPAPAPASPDDLEEGDTAGAYHVQVGAYVREADAESRLISVRSLAPSVVDGRPTLTLATAAGNRPLYRARFGGFSEDDARAACDRLKRLDVTCIVMRAE